MSATPAAIDARQSEHASRALAAEQVRMRHYCKALECTRDPALRARWTAALDDCRGRAARLAIALAEMGEPVPVAPAHKDSMRCLLDAMDMALRNGDLPAAEAVARECVAIIDASCGHAPAFTTICPGRD